MRTLRGPIVAGQEQKVDYVLASNYQLVGGKIRVTAQLFNVSSGQIEETYKSEKDAADVCDAGRNRARSGEYFIGTIRQHRKQFDSKAWDDQ